MTLLARHVAVPQIPSAADEQRVGRPLIMTERLRSQRLQWLSFAAAVVPLLCGFRLLPQALRASRRPADPRWIEFREDLPPPIPTAEQQTSGLIVFRRSLLDRIYPISRPRQKEIVSAVTLDATLGQYEAAQIAVYPLRDLKQVRVSVSDLRDKGRHVLPASEITVRMVRYYGAPLSLRVAGRFGVVPKTLEIAVPLDMRARVVRPYWITVHVPPGQPGGKYAGTITVAHAGGQQRLRLTVDVIPLKLEEPRILYGTLCVNALANLWKGKHTQTILQQADIIFRDQKEHGMNTISLRSEDAYQEVDGHPYLPDLEAAMDLYRKYHFTKPLVYCAGYLFKTNKINRSASYKEYDAKIHLPMARKVAAYYEKRFRDAGLPGIVFVAVEEPNRRSGVGVLDPADIRQRIAGELTRTLKESGALTGLTCTPESVKCAIDYLDYWIVAYKKFTPALYNMARQAHAQLCIYANATMMGQGTYFSRFLFGYFPWANGIKGMLPWTYPMEPKRFPRNAGNRGEGALNVKDGFIGLDGKPVPTIQWELSREGIDDARYLVTIEALARQARATGRPAAIVEAQEAERFLGGIRSTVDRDVRRYTFEGAQTFAPQPEDGWDAERFEATRHQSAEILRKFLSILGKKREAAD
jgi:Glycoside hydrolase 123 N-terminal domain